MKSAKIYQFPRLDRTASTALDFSGNVLNTRKGSKQTNKIQGWNLALQGAIGLIWLLVGMLWPLLNWMGALDVVLQCLRALYYFNTPDIHATLQAGIHTGCYILVSAFVYLYRPKVF